MFLHYFQILKKFAYVYKSVSWLTSFLQSDKYKDIFSSRWDIWIIIWYWWGSETRNRLTDIQEIWNYLENWSLVFVNLNLIYSLNINVGYIKTWKIVHGIICPIICSRLKICCFEYLLTVRVSFGDVRFFFWHQIKQLSLESLCTNGCTYVFCE